MADILEPEDKDKLYDNLLVGQSKVHRGWVLMRWDVGKGKGSDYVGKGSTLSDNVDLNIE